MAMFENGYHRMGACMAETIWINYQLIILRSASMREHILCKTLDCYDKCVCHCFCFNISGVFDRVPKAVRTWSHAEGAHGLHGQEGIQEQGQRHHVLGHRERLHLRQERLPRACPTLRCSRLGASKAAINWCQHV